MEKKILFITICFSFLFRVLAQTQKFDFGDEPEDSTANAYSSLGVAGLFPTCKTCGPAGVYNIIVLIKNINFIDRKISCGRI